MSPRSAIASCYRHYFDFGGRASRTEFWWFAGWVNLGVVVAFLVGALVSVPLGEDWPLHTMLAGWFLVHFIPLLSAQARRLHDWGRSAWWLSFYVWPLGELVVLAMMLPGTQPRRNEWGPAPTPNAGG